MKIDLTKIDGYDKMTPEQKITALESYELPVADYTGYIKKEVFDRTASELSDWKKKYTDTLDENGKQVLKYQELEEKNKKLVRESNVNNYLAKYTGLGYDAELAKQTAEAIVDGDMEKVLTNQQAFNLKLKDNFEKAKLEKTPTPPAGDPKKITKADFDKMNYSAMVKFQQTNPVEFAQFTKE